MAIATDTVNETYPALTASVPQARAALVALARDAGATQEKLDAVRLATSEALTNVVLHAYPDEAGSVHVTAMVAGDELWVLIADDGCGLRAKRESEGLGLGLVLIAQACDDFSIVSRSSGGTEVRMRFDLLPIDARPRRQSRGSVATAI